MESQGADLGETREIHQKGTWDYKSKKRRIRKQDGHSRTQDFESYYDYAYSATNLVMAYIEAKKGCIGYCIILVLLLIMLGLLLYAALHPATTLTDLVGNATINTIQLLRNNEVLK